MKLTPLGLLIAGAGFANVNASPLLLTIVTSNVDTFAQFGSLHETENIALTEARPSVQGWVVEDRPHEVYLDMFGQEVRKPCATMRGKAIEISNGLRNMFGLTLIDPEVLHKDHLGSPHRHHSNPNAEVGMTCYGGVKEGAVVTQECRRHANHHHNFLQRFSRVFVALKWWEGGAVAFVFGCGLGVLLRLMWVLAIVSYRVGFRGESVDEAYDDAPAEETVTLLAPPKYTENAVAYPEEK